MGIVREIEKLIGIAPKRKKKTRHARDRAERKANGEFRKRKKR